MRLTWSGAFVTAFFCIYGTQRCGAQDPCQHLGEDADQIHVFESLTVSPLPEAEVVSFLQLTCDATNGKLIARVLICQVPCPAAKQWADYTLQFTAHGNFSPSQLCIVKRIDLKSSATRFSHRCLQEWDDFEHQRG